MSFKSLRRPAPLALLVAGAAMIPTSLRGQMAVAADSAGSIRPAVVTTPAPFAPADGPHMVAMRLAPADITTMPQAAYRASDRSNVALMGTGAAAVVVGLVIGGDGGTVIALGGAVVGLVGLYRYLR